MKFHDPEVSIPAIGHILVVRKNLIHQIAVDTDVHAMARRILTRTPHLVPAQYQSDVFILPYKFGPHCIAIVIGAEAIVLRVKAVASGDPGIVKVLVGMSDDDDLFVRIVLDDLRSPRERTVARIEFKGQHQVRLSVNRQHAIEILIASGWVASLPVAGRTVSPGAKIVIEILRCRCAAAWIIRVIVMVANCCEVRDVRGVQ